MYCSVLQSVTAIAIPTMASAVIVIVTKMVVTAEYAVCILHAASQLTHISLPDLAHTPIPLAMHACCLRADSIRMLILYRSGSRSRSGSPNCDAPALLLALCMHYTCSFIGYSSRAS